MDHMSRDEAEFRRVADLLAAAIRERIPPAANPSYWTAEQVGRSLAGMLGDRELEKWLPKVLEQYLSNVQDDVISSIGAEWPECDACEGLAMPFAEMDDTGALEWGYRAGDRVGARDVLRLRRVNIR
ncbi:MAG: hypothetical protein AB1416_02150 [Actinomycetota bacterium]